MVQDFYQALSTMGLSDILRTVEYSPQYFESSDKIFSYLDEIASNPNKKVLIYGDYDLDGLCFTLITKNFLDSLFCKNYEVFSYWKRTHELDRLAVRYCIQNNFEYFIIGDTGSSDMETLEELAQYGIKVLVIDHHVCDYNYDEYPELVSVINTQIENRILGQEKYAYSAAALSYVVYDSYAHKHHIDFSETISAFALTSLYSDCMDMSNVLNRALYYKATQMEREVLPSYIRHFLNEYQAFNARFIGYWYAPRINALFRGENFELLNKYFFDDSLDAVERSKCIEAINDYYKKNRNDTKLLVDLIDVQELDHFVIADLETAEAKHGNYVRNPENYTGLVANKISERYNKTAIVYYECNRFFKGSVRDLYGKSYLNIFKHICYAAGHNSAFGLKINLLDMSYFLQRLEYIDNYYSIEDVPNEPIIVNYNYNTPDNTLIEDMALYNEFSGNTIPIAFICKSLIGAMRETQNSYYYRYDWGDYFIQSDYHIDFGTKMIIKPIRSGRVKLLYQG